MSDWLRLANYGELGSILSPLEALIHIRRFQIILFKNRCVTQNHNPEIPIIKPCSPSPVTFVLSMYIVSLFCYF